MRDIVVQYRVPSGRLPTQMAKSQGTAKRLVKEGRFGADLIRFAPGESVAEHTHPGAHILIVVSGTGWLDMNGTRTPIAEGMLYLVPSGVSHAIGATSDELTLIAVANDHRDAAATDRLELTP